MIKLYDYNEEAYNKAIKMFETENKAAIVHPTGTGKMVLV